MAWVICLVSVSRRAMSGARVPSGIRAGMAAAAVSGLLEFAAGGLDRGGQGVDHLVAEVGVLAGGGAAQLEQRGVPGGLGRLGGGFGPPDRAAAVFLAGLGTMRSGSSGVAA